MTEANSPDKRNKERRKPTRRKGHDPGEEDRIASPDELLNHGPHEGEEEAEDEDDPRAGSNEPSPGHRHDNA